MNTSFFIARRYFKAKKKRNFINIISRFSMVGVAVGTAALVIVLSVFNGLEGVLRSLYNTFDPDLKIEAAEGKAFAYSDQLKNTLAEIKGISLFTEVIEDNVMLRYKDGTMVVKMKGVGPNFEKEKRLQKSIVQGNLQLTDGEMPYAIVGRGIQNILGISTRNDFYALQLFYPKNVRPGAMGLGNSNLYNHKIIMPSGIFAIEKSYDEQYIFVPLHFAQALTDFGNKLTSIEVKVDPDYSIKQVQAELKARLGGEFSILNSDEQHSSLLRAIKIEKLFVYLTFSFILAVASFNIFFSLSMLAIEKKKDIAMLKAMGATNRMIKRIFLFEGSLISFSGALAGMAVGFIICWLQEHYGIVSMGMPSSISEAYPVKMIASDFIFTTLSIIIITLAAAFRPAAIAARTGLKTNLV